MSEANYDVCVIGSGAAGGVIAKELCEGGAKVILLEAGESVPSPKFRTHFWQYERRMRGPPRQKQEPFYPADIQNTMYPNCDGVRRQNDRRTTLCSGRLSPWQVSNLRQVEASSRHISGNSRRCSRGMSQHRDRASEQVRNILPKYG